MKLKDKIKLTLNVFRELQIQNWGEDKESDQMEKIANILRTLQENEKYKDDIMEFDDILDEVTKLVYILSEKYIKIGIALERANEGLYIGGNDD